MTLYEFNMLKENDKYQTTWDLGKHIDTVSVDNITINLYAINMFFVEVHYDPITNKMVAIKSFKEGHNLEKYIGSINL